MMHDPQLVAALPQPAQVGLARLSDLCVNLAARLESKTSSLVDTVRELIQRLDYMTALDRLYSDPEEAEARKFSIEEAVNAVAEYESEARTPSLSGFLDDVALAGKEFESSKEKEQGRQRNSVSLMTYHSAKGLEFPIVYMVGMEEGILPHRRSLAENFDDVEEERRLCYVGITRAQDELTLSFPLQRMKWGKPRDTFVSRFLYELTGQADNPNRLRAIRGARDEVIRGRKVAASKQSKSQGNKPPQPKSQSANARAKSRTPHSSSPKSQRAKK
jgi:DNA helicase-2/ATP-dependent DNA helicase PcrA